MNNEFNKIKLQNEFSKAQAYAIEVSLDANASESVVNDAFMELDAVESLCLKAGISYGDL